MCGRKTDDISGSASSILVFYSITVNVESDKTQVKGRVNIVNNNFVLASQ